MKPELNDQPTTPETNASIGEAIANGLTEGFARLMPRKVTFGQYDPKSPFHPDKRKMSKLTRECYQNGARIEPDRTFDAEIDLLNKITRSGRYIDRLVEVVVREDVDNQVVELRYSNSTADQRNNLARRVRDFKDMLEQIVKGQAEAIAAEDAKYAHR